MSKRRLSYIVGAVAVGATSLAGCGSSSSSSGTPTNPPAASVGSTSPTSPAESTTPTTSTGSLPAPCSLVTATDVSSLFGGAALSTSKAQGASGPGTASCGYALKVGTQGREVGVKTIDDYATNIGYVFPAVTPNPPAGIKYIAVPNLGDAAVIELQPGKQTSISVKLGNNVIEIDVEFYDKPVSQSFLIKLATAAVGRA